MLHMFFCLIPDTHGCVNESLTSLIPRSCFLRPPFLQGTRERGLCLDDSEDGVWCVRRLVFFC
jgi:hypothetical protein